RCPWLRDLTLREERKLRLGQRNRTDDASCIRSQCVSGSLVKDSPEQFGLFREAQRLGESFHRGGVKRRGAAEGCHHLVMDAMKQFRFFGLRAAKFFHQKN